MQLINDGIHLRASRYGGQVHVRAGRYGGQVHVRAGRYGGQVHVRAGATVDLVWNEPEGSLVSLAVTVWRLRDPSGRYAACVLAERDQRWQLVVQRGREMLIAERHSSDDSALARANEIWQTFKELGWTEPTH